MHGTNQVADSKADLVHRAALRVGSVRIDPATRKIRGPAAGVTVPPRVMHLLLVLLDSRGAVVAREELAATVWQRRFVAEDSLNGAIAELRKALRTAGADQIEVLTVPKSGYRITCPDFASADDDSAIPSSPAGRGLQRRRLLAGGGATLATLSVIGWRVFQTPSEANQLIEEGLLALRQGLPDPEKQGVAAFRRAAQLEPGNEKAWGLLALSSRAASEYSPPDQVARLRADAELAARRALAINPEQSDALTALALLMPSFGNWLEQERQLRHVLALDPQNRFAVAGLATLLMSTGQVSACLKRLDWLEALDPLSPNLQFRRVYTLWSSGRLADADATADRAMQSWPQHPAVWFARFWTFAFTQRVERAQQMLAEEAARPAMPPPAAKLLDLSLAALDRPAAARRSQAIGANIKAAALGPSQAITAIMVLSSLGAAAESYEVARGFLVQHGPVLVKQRHSLAQPSVTDQHHRMTMMLWIPATENLRLEPRFRRLCEDMGLLRYWMASGTRPDFSGASLETI